MEDEPKWTMEGPPGDLRLDGLIREDESSPEGVLHLFVEPDADTHLGIPSDHVALIERGLRRAGTVEARVWILDESPTSATLEQSFHDQALLLFGPDEDEAAMEDEPLSSEEQWTMEEAPGDL